ncbi:hypothetical protein [Sphingomonas pituitosa]|uniref:hypothetical protein n=1 Tax=Sphingomonas pituitosa TaxID=99597 RepID=UPI00082DD609|nr:hypothetical protein [Sphingomonas pituitosa]
MADLAPNNPTGRTVGQATIDVVSPCGGGGLPDLADLKAERERLWQYRPRTRAKKYAKAERLSQIRRMLAAIAIENGFCANCFENLAGATGPECSSCEELPF